MDLSGEAGFELLIRSDSAQEPGRALIGGPTSMREQMDNKLADRLIGARSTDRRPRAPNLFDQREVIVGRTANEAGRAR